MNTRQHSLGFIFGCLLLVLGMDAVAAKRLSSLRCKTSFNLRAARKGLVKSVHLGRTGWRLVVEPGTRPLPRR